MKSIIKTKFPAWAVCAFAAGALLLGQKSYAQFSSTDADTMMNAYNTAFLQTSGSDSQFDNGFWGEAEQIEGVIDAYNRSGNPAYLTEITQLLNGFSATNGTNWSDDIYNDDCMWACIAYLRGYQATGNSTFLSIATANFNMVWARGWDTSAGGLWWTTADQSKNSCDEDPAAIVAYLLYQTTGNSTYLTDAHDLYNWEVAHLYNPSTGEISDNYANGQANGGATTYNQGTFIGAADYLGDVTNAELAANFLMGDGGLMPDYGEANNNSGFNSIAIRWTAKFMKDHNLENNYLAWLQYNANTAFRIRNSSNLSWCSWEFPTPSGTLDDWSCLSSVVALQDVPPSFPYTYLAAENGTVNFSTPVDVAFGIDGNYFYQYARAGNITFNTATFGDPYFDVAKEGFYTPFTECAAENGSYTFTVPVEAAFGAGSNYAYNVGVSGTVTFNDATFGDPDPGVVKAGYYMPYTFCAMEGQTNTFTSPTDLAFGANGNYNFKSNFTGTIVFNITNFGDPDYGVVKSGYFRPVSVPPASGVTNNSFETPGVGANNYLYNPTGGSWAFSGDSGVQANGSAWGAPTAPSGTQTAFLQISDGANNGTISAPVTFGFAGTYTLSFEAALRASPHNGAISLNVLVDGTVVGTYSPATTNSFTAYTTSPFSISTAGNHTVEFTAVGTATDSTVFVDSVGMTGLANPSFETPDVGTDGYEYNPGGGSWTFSSDTGIGANGSPWDAPTAPAGTQFAFVQIQNGTDNGSFSQMCFCTAGTHTVSFEAALRGSNNGSISLNVLVDGTVVGTYSPTTTTSFTSYMTSSFTTISAANHTVEFEAVGTTAVDATVFIDSVSLQ